MNDQPADVNPSAPKRVFDVTPPGLTMPSATSRPVIVGNRPEQTDQTIQPPGVPTPPPAQPAVPAAPENPAAELQAEGITFEPPVEPGQASVYQASPAVPAAADPAVPAVVAPPPPAPPEEVPVATGSIFSQNQPPVVTPEPAQAITNPQPVPAATNSVVVQHGRGKLGQSLIWMAVLLAAVVLLVYALLNLKHL